MHRRTERLLRREMRREALLYASEHKNFTKAELEAHLKSEFDVLQESEGFDIAAFLALIMAIIELIQQLFNRDQ